MFRVFFFNDTATTEIYTLSLHDALPILLLPRPPRPGRDPDDEPAPVRGPRRLRRAGLRARARLRPHAGGAARRQDRKSTRLNSSHANISYAVFCLKKKKKKNIYTVVTIK